MAKNKKDKTKGSKKNKSLYKVIKPYIKDNRVVFSILGAAGLGVALVSAIRTEKFQTVVDQASDMIKNLRGGKAASQPTTTPRSAKPVATA